MFHKYLTVKSESGDCSIYKNIPIELLPQFRSMCKMFGMKVNIRYRGPRFNSSKGFTKREDAVKFSVYQPSYSSDVFGMKIVQKDWSSVYKIERLEKALEVEQEKVRQVFRIVS
jgi:hypothetical protein